MHTGDTGDRWAPLNLQERNLLPLTAERAEAKEKLLAIIGPSLCFKANSSPTHVIRPRVCTSAHCTSGESISLLQENPPRSVWVGATIIGPAFVEEEEEGEGLCV